jgi:hypothetical protein
MPAVKNLNSNYIITNKSTPLANVIVATHTMFVDGNLLVGGNTTQVTKTDLNISDNIITLNKGEIGSGVTLITAGLEVDRGSSPNVALLWNESFDKWTITTDGTTYGNIAISSGTGAVAIVDDLTPTLGGNLNVLSRTIYSSNVNVIKFENNLAVSTTSVNPAPISNYNIITAKTPESGGSGLYTTNATNSTREVASTRKAIVYSLVL